MVVSPLNITPVDTIGAGDAYAGYFCAALDQGRDFEEALKWASVAGSLACTKVGAQTALPYKKEIEGYVSNIAVRFLKDEKAPKTPSAFGA